MLWNWIPKAIAEPMRVPIWKIAQKTENDRPLSFSVGYDIITAPCADQNRDALKPRMPPAKMRNHRVSLT